MESYLPTKWWNHWCSVRARTMINGISKISPVRLLTRLEMHMISDHDVAIVYTDSPFIFSYFYGSTLITRLSQQFAKRYLWGLTVMKEKISSVLSKGGAFWDLIKKSFWLSGGVDSMTYWIGSTIIGTSELTSFLLMSQSSPTHLKLTKEEREFEH